LIFLPNPDGHLHTSQHVTDFSPSELAPFSDEDPRNRSDSAQPEDGVSELPKTKKFEVKIENQLRPVSRASANPAAEKVSKAIEEINKNKIARQPLGESNSTNASKRASVESKRNSVDVSKRYSVDASKRQSVDGSKRQSTDASTSQLFDATKRNSIDVSKRRSIDGATNRPEVQPTEEPRPSSMMNRSRPLSFAATEEQVEPPPFAPVEIRGGPNKPMAVMESAGLMGPPRTKSSIAGSQVERSTTPQVQIRGGPQKAAAVMQSARHARDGSRSSIASNRHSVGDIDALFEKSEPSSASAKRQSHPPLLSRRSFSESSADVNEQPKTSVPLTRAPSGRKTAERLAWIRELEEGNKGRGNTGRDYMFQKLSGGVKDKLAKFENQQLTGGIARTDSNISRRLSNSSDAYSIEQSGGLKRLSRSATLDDDFRKKLEESVTKQHKNRVVPQEVLDLVALTDGDQEAALNDFMENWNQDELVRQINDAADRALAEDKGGSATAKNGDAVAEPKAEGNAEGATSTADFDPFGPTADLSLKKGPEKKSTSTSTTASTQMSLPMASKAVELPKGETPKAAPSPKPEVALVPTSNGTGTTGPTPATSELPRPKSAFTKPKSAFTKPPSKSVPVLKDTAAPAVKTADSLLLGSAAGSAWNPKPVAAPSSYDAKPTGKETSKPAAPKKAPSPLALSNGNAGNKSPFSSPTKASFTAAALPQFLRA